MDIAPLPRSKPSDALADNDFALYFNGERVRATVALAEHGVGLTVTFETTKSALTDPTVDPVLEAVWAGWKPGDTAHLRQPTPKKFPTNGFVEIESIRPSTKPGEPTYFQCRAMTAVYDWLNDSTVCNASDRVLIPADWFVR